MHGDAFDGAPSQTALVRVGVRAARQVDLRGGWVVVAVRADIQGDRSGSIGSEEILEGGDIPVVSRGEERLEESLLRGYAHRPTPVGCDALSGAPH